MNKKSCIFVVLLAVLTVNAAPGEKDSRCKMMGFGGFGAFNTHCTDKACDWMHWPVPFSQGTCNGGLNCCFGEPAAPQQPPPPAPQQPPPPAPQEPPPPASNPGPPPPA